MRRRIIGASILAAGLYAGRGEFFNAPEEPAPIAEAKSEEPTDAEIRDDNDGFGSDAVRISAFEDATAPESVRDSTLESDVRTDAEDELEIDPATGEEKGKYFDTPREERDRLRKDKLTRDQYQSYEKLERFFSQNYMKEYNFRDLPVVGLSTVRFNMPPIDPHASVQNYVTVDVTVNKDGTFEVFVESEPAGSRFENERDDNITEETHDVNSFEQLQKLLEELKKY